MTEEIDILLARYFGGEASEQELRLLDKWLAQSEENEAYFYEMTLVFQHSLLVAPAPEPDMEKAFATFSEHIDQYAETQTIKKSLWKSRFFWGAIAASAALFIGIFTYVPTKNTADKYVVLTTEHNTIQKNIFPNVEVILAEGTEVTYNPLDKKEITLQRGEATFTVNLQEEEKLRVHVGNAIIEDIGTVFTITAHNPQDSIMVEVVDGEILFHTATKTYKVKASERGIYYPQKDYFELVSKVENIQAIEFRSMPLSQVIAILSKQFDVHITNKSEDVNNVQISVTFDPNEIIDTILNIIAETLSLRVIKTSEKEYVLSY